MIQNCYDYAWQRRGQTVHQWGKDNTGLIEYKINDQGFRSCCNYDTIPDYAFFGNSIVFGIGVEQTQTLVSQFENSHNYGLSGNYMNHHSVTNLQQFVASKLYNSPTKIVFFWVDRAEPIDDMIDQINQSITGVLHISSGKSKRGAINLMAHIDRDVSGTHPGPKTHQMWAKTIKLLLNRA
jgi:hypothetical protein